MSATAWIDLGLLVLVAGVCWMFRKPRPDDRPESQYWDDQSAP